jgi:hypothetical protein
MSTGWVGTRKWLWCGLKQENWLCRLGGLRNKKIDYVDRVGWNKEADYVDWVGWNKESENFDWVGWETRKLIMSTGWLEKQENWLCRLGGLRNKKIDYVDCVGWETRKLIMSTGWVEIIYLNKNILF